MMAKVVANQERILQAQDALAERVGVLETPRAGAGGTARRTGEGKLADAKGGPVNVPETDNLSSPALSDLSSFDGDNHDSPSLAKSLVPPLPIGQKRNKWNRPPHHEGGTGASKDDLDSVREILPTKSMSLPSPHEMFDLR